MADDIWTSINNILGFEDPRKKRNGDWDLLNQEASQGFSLTGIEPQSLEMLKPPPQSPYHVNPDTIQSIKQKADSAFRIITIKPCEDFDPNFQPGNSVITGDSQVIPTQKLIELTGILGSGQWLSKELPYHGNYLKIEFLPIRNSVGNGVVSSLVDETFLGPTYKPANAISQANKLCFISLDNVQTDPIPVTNGTEIEVEFSSAWITYGPTCPNIRITIGYNSKISQNNIAKRISGNFPAFQGEEGLWENGYFHCTPFSISNDNGTAFDTGGGFTDWSASNNDFAYIQAPGTLSNKGAQGLTTDNRRGFGVSLVWITNIEWLMGVVAANDYCLRQWKLEKQNSAGTFIQTIYQWYAAAPRESSGNVPIKNESIVFPHPLRVSLRAGDKIVLRTLDRGNASSWKVNLAGYIYGPAFISVAGVKITPNIQLSEHPYPQDANETLNP